MGPLRAHTRPWDAASFRDSLHGRILQEAAVTRAIVSMSGQATGIQNVLVRADLLVEPAGVKSTRFQMEFLPSGTICAGPVTHVGATDFTATCRIAGGGSRRVTASWSVGAQASLQGTLSVSPAH